MKEKKEDSMKDNGLTPRQLYAISLGCAAIFLYCQGYTSLKSWVPAVARIVAYILLVRGSYSAFSILYNVFYTQELFDFRNFFRDNKKSLALFGIAVSTILYMEERLFNDNFALVFLAYILSEYPSLDRPPIINYGVGMACSFFEGYLVHIIPSDGSNFVGFEENIKMYEDHTGIIFPVRRLFIVITKSLFCPPDMKHFNKPHRTDLAHLEAVSPLSDVVKDVAGVKNRTYRNSVYKIVRPAPRAPVHLSAEFATPLHTFKKVLDKRVVYDKLCDVDKEEVVADFCKQLNTIIFKSPECRGKCELVFFDDTDPEVNLADVLLESIAEIEPDFDQIIDQHRKENPVELD